MRAAWRVRVLYSEVIEAEDEFSAEQIALEAIAARLHAERVELEEDDRDPEL